MALIVFIMGEECWFRDEFFVVIVVDRWCDLLAEIVYIDDENEK